VSIDALFGQIVVIPASSAEDLERRALRVGFRDPQRSGARSSRIEVPRV
jgi:hypothetical protein